MRSADVGRGALLALGTASISGVAVFVSKFGTQAVPDPFVYTTARNAYVGLLLVGLLALTGRLGEVRRTGRLRRADAGRLALLALVGGSVPFLLFFWGLTLTPAPVASFIQKTQFLWVALLAGPLLGEAPGRWQVLALSGLLAGTLLQSPVTARSPGGGEALVLAATLLWSVEAVVARRTLATVDPLTGAAARMAGGAVVLLGFLAVSGRLPVLAGLTPVQWGWVAGPGVLLLAYVLTWYHALRRAPALVVTGVLTLGAPVTALLDAVLVTHRWTAGQALGGALLAAGAVLVTLALWRAARPPAPPRVPVPLPNPEYARAR
jgi:drug/metabolite transporter (DMT)-like permease